MADVSINVMIDGKGVFAYGIASSPDPYNAIVSGLTAAGMHFHTVLALANQAPPSAPASLAGAAGELAGAGQLGGQLADLGQSAVNTKGPSL